MSDATARRTRSGKSALRLLGWVARTGPTPEPAAAAALAWSDRHLRSRVAELIADRWVRREQMAWGDGPLLVATPAGVERVRADARARSRPTAPLWWDHHSACAWTAAWLTVRERRMQGPAEVEFDDSWADELRWHDRRGDHAVQHRPDLAWLPDGGGRVAVEVELSRKATPRLEAVLDLHARWRAAGTSAGVIYICGTDAIRARVVRIAGGRGLTGETGGGLRVELLETITQQAREVAAARSAARPQRWQQTA